MATGLHGHCQHGFAAATARGEVARPRLDMAALAASLLALGLWVIAPDHALAAPALLMAGGLQAARAWGWQPLRTRARPILWILHLAHAWIPVGLVLLALPLYYQLANRAAGSFGWTCQESGPAIWRVRIDKTAGTGAAAAAGSCCPPGACGA